MKRAVVVLGLVACGGKEPTPVALPSNVAADPVGGSPDATKNRIALAVEAFTGFRDEMCKCLDRACAYAVQERMTKWSTKMAEEAGERPTRTTNDEAAQMTELGQAYGDCMTKAMSSGGVTP